ncbi:MAG: tyrosine-protein kinase domain-containing protein [Bacteroidales bacterium]
MKSPAEEIFQQKTDFREILFKVLRYKYYFVVSVIFALAVAFLFNKYAERKYYNRTSLLIKVQGRNSFMGNSDLMESFDIFGGVTNVENELNILRSFSIVNQAVQNLDFEVTYLTEEPLFPFEILPFTAVKELYENPPIQVIMDPTHEQAVQARFYVDIINDSTYRLEAYGEDVPLYDYISNTIRRYRDTLDFSGTYKFGEQIDSEDFRFSVHLKENYRPASLRGKRLFFQFNNLNGLTSMYQARLGISTTSATSSVVIVSLSGNDPRKITDFLNELAKVYLEKNLEKKNTIAYNTVRFIDSRISDIADSLMYAESKLQNFRSNNQVMNISFQGQKLYEKMNSLENERAAIVIKKKYYDYILNYFEENKSFADLVAPSAMDVQDPVLNELISNLLQLNSQRMMYIQQGNEQNLFLKDLDIQISNLKKTIIENIEYNARKTEITLMDLDSRVEKLKSQISRLPKTERELIGMERQFKLNDAIYTFLLQKRAEAQIAQASNTPDYEIIDKAQYFKAGLVAPKTSLNYIIAFFLAVFIPFILIILRDFFNNKITEIKDIELLTNRPIIGQVLHNRFKSKAIIRDYPKSPLADSFRAIRTNLRFFAKGTDKMVILVTSSISGEGKSFCSLNIASVYALLGKKTVLIGFDLRRPALYKEFDLKNEVGISNYLINTAGLNDIIQKTPIKNLDLISAGPVPPNPVELIESDRTKQLMDELREKYDYIIIDSSPIGAVTDSFLLFPLADINLFTIRHNFSQKDAVKANLKNIELKKIPNVSIIVNDVKMKKNAYGYAYQSNYYSDGSRKGILGWFKKKKAG